MDPGLSAYLFLLATTPVFNWFTLALIMYLTGWPIETPKYVKDLLEMPPATALLVALVRSVEEELLFRVVLFGMMTDFLTSLGLPPEPTTLAMLLVSSALFAASHYAWGRVKVMQTFVMGCWFALIYLGYGPGGSALAHAFNNLVPLVGEVLGKRARRLFV